jgi:putative intracellular protease/amidase
MQRGLEGRRIALVVEQGAAADAARVVREELERAGAIAQTLGASSPDEDWHGAKYAALVLVGDSGDGFEVDHRVQQLVREFLVSDKPVGALGSANAAIIEAGGQDEAIIERTAEGAGRFAVQLVASFAKRLEERSVDEMSEQSFPASDPPATTPASTGHLTPDRTGDART